MSEHDKLDEAANHLEAATEAMKQNFQHIQSMMDEFAKSHENLNMDPFNLSAAYSEWLKAATSDPKKLVDANMRFFQNSMALSQQMFNAMLGQSSKPVITEEAGDRRFKHEDWSNNPVFGTIKQSYLLTSKWMRDVVQDVEGLDEKTAEKVEFFTERYLDALSPTNFAATNPAVIEKVLETKGENLISGLKNMMADMDNGSGQLNIRMTDTEAFTLGENVAATPGKVVFQNRMFQLIQYTPTTEKVLKRPLMIVPPWINKFYILDLQPKNSMLKWLTDQGHTVFVVSWVNPDETYRDVGFETYMKEGVLTAVDAVEAATGESDINAIGYCIGGTLLSLTLSYMKQIGDERIKSATFFTTMIDFSEPGELGVFIDEEQIQNIEERMDTQGYLDGAGMSGAFNLMRANDLIWSFYINNYLLGNDARPFDLLFWNSDSTRMPAKMHSWYLRNMYLENQLCKPQAVTVEGVDIDLSKIDIPSCFISAVDDHIAPWLSTYKGAKLLGGKTRFILGGSGHIAGIVNPPTQVKYGYRFTDDLPDDPQTWADSAEQFEGSWWPEWDKWVRALDNKQVAARKPGSGALKVIEDAPGTYVKCRLGEPVPKLETTVIKPVAKKTATKAKASATKKPAAKKATAKKPASKKAETKPVAKAKPATKKSTDTAGAKQSATVKKTEAAKSPAKAKSAAKKPVAKAEEPAKQQTEADAKKDSDQK
ncbi:PHA/PHB synthase family protein [Leucothrix pacifica]|uniref:Class I poly(R)-hydroxyalkanoic acid synthase n=1 Tax=Leucothrix pacifica TaxID=1247513 RepID=A0A317C7Q8_9GAMM|nr:class I poly(R)-hydroxyalkanoic acid synthase [Leucothrix pacifica]PWQ94337.1 class I poly(R)-hydroxyalkanoic acid synthase [Leucothrix pacifica]